MQIEGKKFLVTGGAGFIGSHVVDALIEQKASEVIVFDNFYAGNLKNLSHSLKSGRAKIFMPHGDILHRSVLDSAMKGVDGVFHLAALWLLHCQEFPDAAFKVNVEGTFNVVSSAIQSGVKKIVYSSSASVYGDALQPEMTEQHPLNNETFYGATKIASEQLGRCLAIKNGLNFSSLRYMNVYGPRQDYKGSYTAVISKLYDHISAGNAPTIHGDGLQSYDFIHVKDIAKANVLAMASTQEFESLNIGSGVSTSVLELTQLMQSLLGSNAEPKFIETDRPFVTRRVSSTKLAKEKINFIYNVSLEEGLKDYINWRKSNKES